jgi:DHA1 family multidrug resistance protein-like MFS transporter
VGILAFGMAIVIPSITVMISQYAETEAGGILGLLTGANSLGQTLGPLVGSLLFVMNIHLPYLLSAVLLLVASVYVRLNYKFLGSFPNTGTSLNRHMVRNK